MKQLSRTNLPETISSALLELPEKVLQFGTGVLLRGLPDYFIDKANKQGVFNGRVVVVKSTSQGDTTAFEQQDGLYTVCIRGIENGQAVSENIVNASISRVLAATTEWQSILDCAANPQMELIISNTTEVGISLVEDDVHAAPPVSFPGKLLAFLLARYTHFKGAADKGMVIVPTELLPDNGHKLKSVVLQLARNNRLDEAFIQWVSDHNHFCNSLVDRIVPGKQAVDVQAAIEQELGYTDQLMIMSEVYRLWAIESSSEKVKRVLSFAAADNGVVIVPDINVYRELKLRLLNGSHTMSCGLAVLAGFDTVKEAMEDADMSACIEAMMMQEIVPAITDIYIREDSAWRFAGAVLDRYRNPHIAHRWISITMQYTSKMKMRDVPILLRHYQRSQEAPALLAMGFAAYLLFMRSERTQDGRYEGSANGVAYTITDDHAAWFYDAWKRLEPSVLVRTVLSNTGLWGTDLCTLKGFPQAVSTMLGAMMTSGVASIVKKAGAEAALVK
ncbi:tagaturonate reductase [Chitinophaga horti]|uniref:Tagaturonate reductase n=1 Tax=Chitinophaga horti TaxID=2920382 RepID=A0ABY6J8I1_9BACT|nr:tagaturonate reductase [Chitinophaga horti]UYQ94882.1 tagaturonate reductase [Chitinophaga horti]